MIASCFVYSVRELLQFFSGFMLGTVTDAIFYNVYKWLDPDENNGIMLSFIVCIQLFVLVLLITLTFNIEIYRGINKPTGKYFLRMGIITSQIFLLRYSMKRFGRYLKTFGLTNPVIRTGS